MIINDTNAKLTPHKLLEKHRRLEKTTRMKAVTGPARQREIRERVDQMRAQFPGLDIHKLYLIVGRDMGILH